MAKNNVRSFRFSDEVAVEDIIDWVTRQTALSLSLINDVCGYSSIRDILEKGKIPKGR